MSNILLVTFIYLVVIALLIALNYYSNKKRKNKIENLLGNLKIGDRIITIGGIYGNIEKINEDGTLLIKVDKNSHLTISLSSVSEAVK